MHFTDRERRRFDIGPRENRGIEAFKDHLWYDSECCKQCFSRVRAVGNIREVRKAVHTHTVNEFYERTDLGIQDHHPFTVAADRYGQCFCLECGSDLSANKDNLDFETFKDYARNIYRYTKLHTPLDLDHRRFAREAVRLKHRRDTQGRDRLMLAVAFARALAEPPAQAQANTSAAPAD